MIHAIPPALMRSSGWVAGRKEEFTPAMVEGVELFFIFALVAVIAIPIVIGIFYCLTLQKALSRCAPQNRTLSPGLVWLYLVPLFNLVWHFFIVVNMAKSLHAEFVYRNMLEEESPGQGIGLAACILHVVSLLAHLIPFLGWLVWIAGLVCWIIYWVKIAGFSNKIAVPYALPQPPAGVTSA
ncbi:MAG: hypothetical protein QUS33_11910 [Dehalococcoidia bacterium]|nr:hypothetical protein [Dehalococcoidia bacterium]